MRIDQETKRMLEQLDAPDDAINVHLCISVIDDCKNLQESYGEICVRCNKCGRFDKEAADED